MNFRLKTDLSYFLRMQGVVTSDMINSKQQNKPPTVRF